MFLKKFHRVFFVSLVLLLGCGNKAQTREAFPFKIKDLKGLELSVPDAQKKIVFLEFWATWCPPCVMASPDIEKLVEEYKGKNIQFIHISLDQDEEVLKEFVLNRHMQGHVALAGDSGIDTEYHVQGIPSFFIIDKNGIIGGAWEGYHPMMVNLWRKKLDQLLSIKS